MAPRTHFAAIVLWIAAAVTGLASGHEETQFLAGAATVDVTPREPVPMWGYGARHASLSEGTLDPLQATVLVLQAGSDRLAIVGLDLGRAPAEESLQRIRTQLLQQHGIANSLIAGSHTHHGPVLELSDRPDRGRGRFDAALRYTEWLETAIIEAAGRAVMALRPAKLAAGSAELPNFNRNRHTKRNPAPLDARLCLLRLDDAASGQPLAVLANFAAHPTSLPQDQLQFSADFVGALRREIQSSHGGQVVFMQGAAGDLSTNRGPFGDHAAYGAALGQEAVRILQTLKPKAVDRPSIRVREERFTFASRINLQNPLTQAVYSVAFFPELVLNFADEYAEGVRPRLTVAVLNRNIALVGVSGEFFCEHAVRLRQRSKAEQVFFFGYCNGYHQYFPTIEAAAEGGYGADSQVAPAEIGAGERMMDKALQWIFELQGTRF
ncbi:MAG: neutral/alkaline non-lysosomal ceramidase N-terminal domain-containing protein [Planctomycetaceae bacterium]